MALNDEFSAARGEIGPKRKRVGDRQGGEVAALSVARDLAERTVVGG